jgi:hypothetical protein
MISYLYNAGKVVVLRGSVDLAGGAIKVALVTSGYVADKDAHDYFNDVTNEVSGNGYTAGGKALTGAAVNQDNTNDRAIFAANNVVWSVAAFTARAAVLYKSTGSAATSPLIAFIDFGEDRTVSGQDFSIVWHQDGILYLGE